MKRQREGLKEIDGATVLDNEAGTRFYHKHLSPKRKRKKKSRTARRRARRDR